MNNIALTNGASFQFDIFPPTLTNNTFVNNTSPYGPNQAGQAYKIINQSDPTNTTYVSGQAITGTLTFALVDNYGQTITTDNTSVLTISAASGSNGAKVIGNTDVTVSQGVASFTSITFINQPGTSSIAYTVTSSNINYVNIQNAFNKSQSDLIQKFSINFRLCEVGEEEKNGMCNACPTGKYSILQGSTECSICPKNA